LADGRHINGNTPLSRPTAIDHRPSILIINILSHHFKGISVFLLPSKRGCARIILKGMGFNFFPTFSAF
jgi:hypothetical protein